MTVRGIGFVGMRSDRLDEMVRLFRDVLGVPLVRRDADLAGFRLADDTILELYGPAEAFHSFFRTGPVVGFRVADFDATRQAMITAGVQFIGDVQYADGDGWQHFYCPDGTIAEIIGRSAEPPSVPAE